MIPGIAELTSTQIDRISYLDRSSQFYTSYKITFVYIINVQPKIHHTCNNSKLLPHSTMSMYAFSFRFGILPGSYPCTPLLGFPTVTSAHFGHLAKNSSSPS